MFFTEARLCLMCVVALLATTFFGCSLERFVSKQASEKEPSLYEGKRSHRYIPLKEIPSTHSDSFSQNDSNVVDTRSGYIHTDDIPMLSKKANKSLYPSSSSAPPYNSKSRASFSRRAVDFDEMSSMDPDDGSVENSLLPSGTESKPDSILKNPARSGFSKAPSSPGVRVRAHDTLSSLSNRYGVPKDVLMKINGIDDSTKLYEGQYIKIPVYFSSKDVKSSSSLNPGNPSESSSAVVRPARRDSAGSFDKKSSELKKNTENKSQADSKIKSGISSIGTKKIVVQSGDTLFSIAKRSQFSVDSIRSANKLRKKTLRVGQVLILPEDRKALDSSASVSSKSLPHQGEKKESITLAAPTKEPETLPLKKESSLSPSLASSRLRWPVRGRIISPYGKGSGNARDGIDIQVPLGTPIKAAEGGVIIYAGNGLKNFGNTVLVRHENGLVTVYGHASELNVTRGQQVKRGQQIAVSGMSGASESPRLHFEVRKNSSPVDPSEYLE